MRKTTPKKSIRATVHVSDFHFGSIRSLMQPGFETLEGQEIGRTMLSKWLWDRFQDSQKWLHSILDPMEYALVINGDCIEGNHHRTNEIWSPNASDHSKAAKEGLLDFAKRAGKVFMVKGTACHVGSSEDSIAETLGAQVNPETKQRSWQNLRLDVAGVRMSVRHHFPATSRSYLEASQHTIQLGNAVNEAVRSGGVAPQIIVGAHRHRTGHYCDGNRLTVVTGAWQGLTEHGYKVVPDGVVCPSIYILDWRGVPDGELPVVHFRRFNPPSDNAVAI